MILLKATDVLAVQSEIDPKRLAIIGESNGGRFAVLACALAPSLKGVIGISTSGYGTEEIDHASVDDLRLIVSIVQSILIPISPPFRLRNSC